MGEGEMEGPPLPGFWGRDKAKRYRKPGTRRQRVFGDPLWRSPGAPVTTLFLQSFCSLIFSHCASKKTEVQKAEVTGPRSQIYPGWALRSEVL